MEWWTNTDNKKVNVAEQYCKQWTSTHLLFTIKTSFPPQRQFRQNQLDRRHAFGKDSCRAGRYGRNYYHDNHEDLFLRSIYITISPHVCDIMGYVVQFVIITMNWWLFKVWCFFTSHFKERKNSIMVCSIKISHLQQRLISR